MVAFRYELIGQLNGASWQRRAACQHAVCKSADIHYQVSRRDSADIFSAMARQPGRDDLADKGGGACASQDDPQIVFAQQRGEEAVDRCTMIVDVVE